MLKRVCYVIPSLSAGGTENQLVNLAKALVRDHEITIVCTRYAGALAGDIRRAGCVIREMGSHSGWDLFLRRRLTRLFRSHRPDVVHSFMFGFDHAVNRAADAVGVPAIVSSRRQLATWKKRHHILLQRRANRYVDCIVANCQAVRDFAIEQEQADPALFRVIYNGIDTDKFKTDANRYTLRTRFKIPPFHTTVVGMVANFSSVKDHELFVKIAQEVAPKRPDVHFILVGEGPLVRNVEKLVLRAELDDRFTHITTLEEIPELHAMMDVSVLCSKTEGFPNVAMESMAAGTPVVASNVGGIPELITDGETGRLISSREPADFAQAIIDLLENPDQSQAIAQRAARYVHGNLSNDRMADAYRALYAELIMKSLQEGG